MLTGVGGRTGLRSTPGVRVTRGAQGARAAHAARAANRRRARRWRRLAGAAAVAVGLAALFVLALGQSRSSALSSDGASNILQAQAMLHGNPLLRGWWTSDVSFYTTELPEYALVVAARGVSPDVVHLCGALTYTLCVALAGLLARGPVRGPAGLRRAGIAVAIMLAPSVLGGTEVFLENPDHFGTSVPVLLALLLVDRAAGRDQAAGRGWPTAVAVCALLALTQVGDELSLVAGTAAIGVVGAARAGLAALRRRFGTGARLDALLAAAAAVSVVLARIAQWALRAAGGFDQRPIPGARLAPLGQLPGHAAALYQSLVLLFGANNPGAPSRPFMAARHLPLVLSADLHVVGLAAAGAGLVAGIAAAFFGWPGQAGRSGQAGQAAPARRPDRPRVEQILVTSIIVTLAAALFSTLMVSLTSAHEVAILLPLGAVLAGRTLPSSARALTERLAAARARSLPAVGARDRTSVPRPAAAATAATTATAATAAATVALAAWLAAGVAEAGYGAAWPPSPVPVQTVASWLVAHHLRDGLAAYWQGTDTTVAAGGRVVVAPVTASGAAAEHWEASSDWYQPTRYRPTFVVAQPHPAQAEDSLSVADVVARFGPPAAEYHVGRDVVLTYRYNLLTRLRGRAFPGSP